MKYKSLKLYFVIFGLIVGLTAAWIFVAVDRGQTEIINQMPYPNPSPTGSPAIRKSTPIPPRKTLLNDYHIFQTFNNCGPAAFSMTLSYYGINESQEKLGKDIRPYQVSAGINDDKSVTLDELAKKGSEYNFIPYHRPMGDSNLVKQFIANDIPVLTRTWTKPAEDIGHYRVIKGYDDTSQVFIQDDSLQGKNLTYSYSDFNELWKKFNYEYLVLVPSDKKQLAEEILGENADYKVAWKNAAKNSQDELARNPSDIYAKFNLSVALYNTGDYNGSVSAFEEVEAQLPFRTLWYQIEPIQAYFELGNYDRVFAITNRILNNQNLAFSELYILRGKIYKNQGNVNAARDEFQKAVIYNTTLTEARELLSST